MPQHTQSIPVTGMDNTLLQALAYGALESLNWSIKYAGDSAIVAYTPRSWNKYECEIIAESSDGQLSISSRMIHNEAFDMMGRNKKFVTAFTAAFGKVKSVATEEQVNAWKEKIAALKEATLEVAQQEMKQAQEVEAVMNLSKSNLYLTYGIIGVNILVFIAMAASGISILQPTGIDIIKWGANFSPLTLSGDWWRLISCVFVHIGIIHLVFNMYALYMVGVYLEPMLGKKRFMVAYLSTGVMASLASLWWHSDPVPSAGASGAIFGMYGVFLALLSTRLIPSQVRNKLLQSIGVFVAYNLIYGMKSGVDNAAHIGGLLSGLAIGFVYFVSLKAERENKKTPALQWIIALAVLAITVLYLQQNKTGAAERQETLQVINETKFKDGQKFLQEYNEFVEMQNRAMAPLKNKSQLMDESLNQQLDAISMPEWIKAGELVEKMKGYDVSDKYKKKISIMDKYVQLRKQQIGLIKQYILAATEENEKALNEVNRQIDDVVEEMNNL
jgi:rhomboid protease GluP